MKTIFLVLIGMFSSAAFSQRLPFKNEGGIEFHRTNLVVRWIAPENPWPKTIWVYQVIPTKFSPEVISNLMAIGSFTEKDKTNWNGIGFSNSGRHLQLNFTGGEIFYDSRHVYSRTNVPKGVPETNQLFGLTTNLISKVGIDLSEVKKDENGKPIVWFDPSDHGTTYHSPQGVVTIVNYRRTRFSRVIDGIELGFDDGEVEFGEHGKITMIQISWRSLAREKSYPAATPSDIIKWMREGRAFQKRFAGPRAEEKDFDWATVKSVTVKKAKAIYAGDSFFRGKREDYKGDPNSPSWVKPYANLWVTVDTGTTNIDVQIVCPIMSCSFQNRTFL